MLNYIKESFSLTNKYIILATPLILFSLLSSVYIVVVVSGGKAFGTLLGFLLVILMFAAFLAGWFGMVRDCIKDDDDFENPNMLISNFPAGVGEYFLPMLGLMFNVFLISSALVAGSYFLGMKLIGDIGIQPEALAGAMESMSAMKAFLTSLSEAQLLKLNAWNLLLFFTMSLNYFLFVFYAPAVFFKNKNPFKALWISFKDLFSRKFLSNLALYLFVFVTYFVLSIFTTVLGMNIVLHFLFTLINFYYLVFAVILIFNYYYINYAQTGRILDEKV